MDQERAQDRAVKNILVTGQHGNGLYTLKDISDFTIIFLGVTGALGPQRAKVFSPGAADRRG